LKEGFLNEPPNRSSSKLNQISSNLINQLVDPANTMPRRRPTRSYTVRVKRNKKSSTSTVAKRRPPTRKTRKAAKSASPRVQQSKLPSIVCLLEAISI